MQENLWLRNSPISCNTERKTEKKHELSDTFSIAIWLCLWVCLQLGSFIAMGFGIRNFTMMCACACNASVCVSFVNSSFAVYFPRITKMSESEWMLLIEPDIRSASYIKCETGNRVALFQMLWIWRVRVQCHFGTATKGRCWKCSSTNVLQSNIYIFFSPTTNGKAKPFYWTDWHTTVQSGVHSIEFNGKTLQQKKKYMDRKCAPRQKWNFKRWIKKSIEHKQQQDDNAIIIWFPSMCFSIRCAPQFR